MGSAYERTANSSVIAFRVMVPSMDVPVDVYSFVSPAMDAVPIDAVDPLAPLILPLYTHFAVDAAPATVLFSQLSGCERASR